MEENEVIMSEKIPTAKRISSLKLRRFGGQEPCMALEKLFRINIVSSDFLKSFRDLSTMSD